jgi:tungstate transport system permease protein
MESIVQGLLNGLFLIGTFNPELYRIILRSLQVSGSAMLIATAIGGSIGTLVALQHFSGRRIIINILNTFMGLPPVVAGLVIYLILSRSGPLGFLELLFTPSAMIIAQTILATPIIAALTLSAIAGVPSSVRETALGLGASRIQAVWVIIKEARFAIMAAIIAGFGRIVAEVGAVMMVGGNLKGYTRVMTTAIALDTSRGDFELAIALGLILILISFLANAALHVLQGRVNP